MTQAQFGEEQIVAAFHDGTAAERAADELRASGVDASRVRVGSDRDERAELQAEMKEELEKSVIGPGNFGPFTKEMQKGIGIGMGIAVPLGVLLGVIIAALPIWGTAPRVDLWMRVLVGVAVGASAGATLGFVLGGGWKPAFTNEGEPVSDRGLTVAVSTTDPDEAERAASTLRRHGAARVDRVTADGQPIERVDDN